MANIFDTAKYILEKNGGKMSTMKLQKLCYYSQAWALVWDDQPLFDEDFEAWVSGPVCRKLFERMKSRFFAYEKDEYGGDGDLSDDQKDTIDRVYDHYGGHDAQWLSQLTCMEEPWQKARAEVADQAHSENENIISKESMSMYYRGL